MAPVVRTAKLICPVKPCGLADVRDVGGPNLMGVIDGQLAQQVRVNLVGRVFLARVGLATQRLDARALHEPLIGL